ncbi:damage-control phosphatase ARMT1 family protein [Breznakibacter xylanolyticus]|nr:ARMT1-like domain-containing protein [Breznakibacter xylanolyticus]
MISDYRCHFCMMRAFERLLNESQLTSNDKTRFTIETAKLTAQLSDQFSAPAYARDLHALLKSYTKDPDPYQKVKKESNDLVMSLYPKLKKQIIDSDNPFSTALRLAIAGNIIDFAVGNSHDIRATIERVLTSDFAIDHSSQLKTAISNAESILYLGDNCGEIVTDKLFIEHLMHPHLTYAVRGSAVINDATLEDTEYIGMHHVADVISNSYDAPSTILPSCSDEFKHAFASADVIISKGQGNFEGLWGKTDKRVFFLLMIKCDVIAEVLNLKKGDFVVIDNHTIHGDRHQDPMSMDDTKLTTHVTS